MKKTILIAGILILTANLSFAQSGDYTSQRDEAEYRDRADQLENQKRQTEELRRQTDEMTLQRMEMQRYNRRQEQFQRSLQMEQSLQNNQFQYQQRQNNNRRIYGR